MVRRDFSRHDLAPKQQWRVHPVFSVRLSSGGSLFRAGSLLTLGIFLALTPAVAQPAGEKPDYLRQLDTQYRAGDWVLQCDAGIDCRILGVVGPLENPSEVRPVVIIDRLVKKDAPFQVQIAFIDSYGQVQHARDHDLWRLVARADPAASFTFELTPQNDAGALPVNQEQADGIVSWLRTRRSAVLDDGAGRTLRLPRGDLDGLLRRMDQIQRPKTDPLTKDQRATWLKPYRFNVVRAKRRPAEDAPDAVTLGCGERPYPRYIDALQLDAEHAFWIAHCAEGSRMYLQKSGQAPVPFDLRRFEGGIQRDVYAHFDPDTSLLTVEISQGQRGDCGDRVRFGWTDQQAFGIIEHRRLRMCRHVPADLWPLFWSPTSWRNAGAPPQSAGDAASDAAR
jgi:hypothetical protein